MQADFGDDSPVPDDERTEARKKHDGNGETEPARDVARRERHERGDAGEKYGQPCSRDPSRGAADRVASRAMGIAAGAIVGDDVAVTGHAGKKASCRVAIQPSIDFLWVRLHHDFT